MNKVVVGPILSKIESIKGELGVDYGKLWDILRDRVEVVKKRGIKKERMRQHADKRVKVGGVELSSLLKEARGLKGKKRYRVEIGIMLMFITGMRIGGLLLLDDKWFKDNIVDNKTGDITLRLTKQRVGDKNRIMLGIKKENKDMIRGLYEEYIDRYGAGLYSVARETITREINSVFKVVGGTSHSLRYTRISEVARTQGLIIAKQFVGHKHIETTNRYILDMMGKEIRKTIAGKADVGLVLKEVWEGDGGGN